MRKDIEVHINTGDVTLSSKERVTIRDFQWIERPDDQEQRYLYGEITVPAVVLEDTILKQGIYIDIPYTPIYKEFKIRIKREYSDDLYSYLRNPKDGSDWFIVRSSIYGGTSHNLYASELIIVSERSYFLMLNEEYANIYSSNQSDFNIVPANWQNRNLLLKCVPGNSYRYPLSGVGLIRWINSNISATKLAQTLKEQFQDDGTPVIAAKYDFNNKQLYLNVDTSSVD